MYRYIFRFDKFWREFSAQALFSIFPLALRHYVAVGRVRSMQTFSFGHLEKKGIEKANTETWLQSDTHSLA